MESAFIVNSLKVCVESREVVKDFSVVIRPGEIHALMGPNGSGKSSLAYAIAGHPEYRVTAGSARLGDIDLLALKPEERAHAGLFLSFQEPPEVGGVSMRTFLTTITPRDKVPNYGGPTSIVAKLGLEESFLSRFLNEGFSGGEKKKSELLQLSARRPTLAILDEVDSGLDVDMLKSVAKIISDARETGTSFLVITHTPQLLSYIHPDRVHVLIQGKCVASGGREILAELDKDGFDGIKYQYNG